MNTAPSAPLAPNSQGESSRMEGRACQLRKSLGIAKGLERDASNLRTYSCWRIKGKINLCEGCGPDIPWDGPATHVVPPDFPLRFLIPVSLAGTR